MARMFNQMENYVTFEDGSMIHRDELSVVYAVSIRFGKIIFDAVITHCYLVEYPLWVFKQTELLISLQAILIVKYFVKFCGCLS